MGTLPLKTFVHPAGVYRLDYPAHWDQVQQDDSRSCGFGPHERDDVGLWISILPMSVDTERLADDLPKLLGQAFPASNAANLRHDATLRHFGLRADIVKEGEAGHYWVVAGGDVVLFASSQVPAGERDVWNPEFDLLMASLQITRDNELFMRQLTNEVLEKLRQHRPDQDFQLDEKGIRGKNQMVFMGNLYREVRAAPSRRAEIIKHFVEKLSLTADPQMGHEQWDDVRNQIIPVLKPRDYIQLDRPTQHLYITDWLMDVVICYAIKSKNAFRFVTGWDLGRWGTPAQAFHDLAMQNLALLSWPRRLEGSRQPDGGRVILVETGDSLAASRLLHPELHRVFAGPLGTPFLAGIPDRDTLVLFSNRKPLKKRICRQLAKDHRKSAYPITPRAFLVTADGIAPAPE
jgi:uncharacterized protein YtpQ (UPF0354 family)